jgi:hypothetical protein
MWCVAELNDQYIAKMEDVLETYEKPYDPQEPVVCVDEKPVTLHADVRRIPDLKMLRRESRAWNRRMNRDRVNINWRFDRRAARRKFGSKRKSFKRSET